MQCPSLSVACMEVCDREHHNLGMEHTCTHYVARLALLEDVEQYILSAGPDGGAVVNIHGLPLSGRTQLALAIARKYHQEAAVDDVLYVDVDKSGGSWCHLEEEISKRSAGACAGHKAVLVLDNWSTFHDLPASYSTELAIGRLGDLGYPIVLICGRYIISHSSVHNVLVQGMEPEECRQLFWTIFNERIREERKLQRKVEEADEGEVFHPQPMLDQLVVHFCENLAFCCFPVRVAASSLAHRVTLSSHNVTGTAVEEVLRNRSIVEGSERILDDLLLEVLQSLDRDAHTVLRRMSIFASPVPVESISHICEGITNVPLHCNRLVMCSLVSQGPGETFLVQSAVRAFALSFLTRAEEMECHSTMIRLYAPLTKAVGREDRSMLLKKAYHHEKLCSLTGSSDGVEYVEAFKMFVDDNLETLLMHGSWRELVNIMMGYRRAVERIGGIHWDHEALRAEYLAGSMYRRLGQASLSTTHLLTCYMGCLQRERDAPQEETDFMKGTMGSCSMELAIIQQYAGNLYLAITYYTEALAHCNGMDLWEMPRPAVLNQFGRLSRSVGLRELAVELFVASARAKCLSREWRGLAVSIHCLASVYIDACQEGMGEIKRFGDPMAAIGKFKFCDSERTTEAGEKLDMEELVRVSVCLLELSFRLKSELEDQRGLLMGYCEYARLLLHLELFDLSLSASGMALRMSRLLGDRQSEGKALELQGDAMIRQGERSCGVGLLDTARVMFERVGAREDELRVCSTLARLEGRILPMSDVHPLATEMHRAKVKLREMATNEWLAQHTIDWASVAVQQTTSTGEKEKVLQILLHSQILA